MRNGIKRGMQGSKRPESIFEKVGLPNAQARRYGNEYSNRLTTEFYRNRGNGNDYYTHKLVADVLGDVLVFLSIPHCKQCVSAMGLRGSNSYARCCLIVTAWVNEY